MAKHTYLKNAPIAEAIIDFRVVLPQDFKVEQFSDVRDRLCDRYPNVEERCAFALAGQINVVDKCTSVSTKGPEMIGYFFKTSDSLNVAQFRIDGFTFSRLKPYTRWEEVSEEAFGLWDLYRETCSPQIITRIAVRFINRLDLPGSIDELRTYLTVPPSVPNELQVSLQSFLTRAVIYESESDIMANITRASERSIKADFFTVILDIDVYKSEQFNPESERIWSTFESLRRTKNKIFFESITENTVRLYK